MRHILDLDRYPLDRPGTPEWQNLVDSCRADLARDGMYNLVGLVKREALETALEEIAPVMDTLSFTHKRRHNIYFRKEVPGLAADHPALTLCETAATMDKPALFPARDALARVNVMAYRDGEALNWHFDRSEFTTTLLLQAPDEGGDFVYRSDLRSDTDPNYDGVAKLLRGEDPEVRTLKLAAGTLNVFRGKNTAHKVSTVKGNRARIIAVFSYFDRPGVVFSREDQVGFYGRTA
jgi:hypothetical protein